MRVLEILRRSLKVYKELRKTCDCSDCDVSRDKTDRRIAETEEAIKEYQELKARDKQKNCEECYKKVDAALKAIDSQSAYKECAIETTICSWKLNNSEDMYIGQYWDSACGHSFQFMEGGLEENNFIACPYCSGTIEEMK